MPATAIRLAPLTSLPSPHWLMLRHALWPEATVAEHEQEMADQVADPGRYGQFIALADDGRPLGLAEVSVRSDYVNGTESSPVAFLEGLYVVPAARRRGVARALLQAVKEWARVHDCRELASDTRVGNRLGQSVHRGLGFTETERVVYFNLVLDGPEPP